MSHMRYIRVGSKKSSTTTSTHGIRGFRINSRRFSVQRLRSKFWYLLKLFSKLRSSYGRAMHSMRKVLTRSNSSSSSCKKDGTIIRKHSVVMKKVHCNYNGMDDSRLRSFARTNSFYSEAIADCLDFIKRNSLSMEENPVLNQR